MGELGYVEGRNVHYEVRVPQKEGGPFTELAADNLTGINLQFDETTGKRLQRLQEMRPKLSRVAFLWYDGPGVEMQTQAARQATQKLGVKLQVVEISAPDALPAAFEEAVRGRAEALLFPSGGLKAYGPDDREFFRQAAAFVDKILKGAKPGDLPVEQPTRWELVINLKTAKALGITVPQSMRLQAERVIE